MIDRVELIVKAGNGGNGCVSFRREKFVPFGGPNGGDGGDGGSIVLIADRGRTTLSHLKHRKSYRADDGGHGKGKDQHGRKGKALVIRVPQGTIVRCLQDSKLTDLGDLASDGQELVVARGGRGGWGNARFATSVNQAPRTAKKGEPGEERRLALDLKLLADVGLVGRPNVGKSTLINMVSAARSKVAEYPFTTIEPVLGVVEMGYHSFVVADIPGLIEGAHSGRGLGYDFLRHIERTRILLHIIDGDSEHPDADLEEVNAELSLYNPALEEKAQIVAVNKIDIPSVRQRLPQLEERLGDVKFPVFFISAATGEGIGKLLSKVAEVLAAAVGAEKQVDQTEFKVFHPKPTRRGKTCK